MTDNSDKLTSSNKRKQKQRDSSQTNDIHKGAIKIMPPRIILVTIPGRKEHGLDEWPGGPYRISKLGLRIFRGNLSDCIRPAQC